MPIGAVQTKLDSVRVLERQQPADGPLDDRRMRYAESVQAACPCVDVGAALHQDRERVEPDDCSSDLRILPKGERKSCLWSIRHPAHRAVIVTKLDFWLEIKDLLVPLPTALQVRDRHLDVVKPKDPANRHFQTVAHAAPATGISRPSSETSNTTPLVVA